MKSKSICSIRDAVGHGQRGEAADGGIEGDVPRVVDRRHKGEANLAHDLEPKLERGAGISSIEPGEVQASCLRRA